MQDPRHVEQATGTTPSRRPPGRREELLSAALNVIRRLGPTASMEDMAAASGITKPVLYRYFGDRDGLIAALADRFAGSLVDRLTTALAAVAGAGPEDRIRAAVTGYVLFIEEDPALYGFLIQRAPPGSAALIDVIDRVAAVISAEMRITFEELGIDTRPVPAWSHGIVGMVHLAGAHWARRPDSPRSQLIDDLVALAAYGITGAVPGGGGPAAG